MRTPIPAALATCLVLAVAAPAAAQSPTVHRLDATPSTVAYGYYWSQAKPAITVKSGDVVDVETMLTNTPAGLEHIGVKPADVPQHLRDIVAQDTGAALKGPGGHILTGPIYVEGADSGDVLEVHFESIALPIDYGYNGCAGFVRELCGPNRVSTLIHLDRTLARTRAREQQSAGSPCRQHGQPRDGRRDDAVRPGLREGRAARDRRRARGAGRR
jgi:hypothetical protein